MRAWPWLLSGVIVLVCVPFVVSGNHPGTGRPLAAKSAATATATPSDPRQAEYATVTQLRAGINIAKFEEALGSAYFIRASKDGAYIEKTFRGPGRGDPTAKPDFWVQAVQDTTGTVQLMAVTRASSTSTPSSPAPPGK